jgi:regulator of replication initiation timing
MSNEDKLKELERQIKYLSQQNAELNKRIQWLERENNRRKADIQQVKK